MQCLAVQTYTLKSCSHIVDGYSYFLLLLNLSLFSIGWFFLSLFLCLYIFSTSFVGVMCALRGHIA